jgi:hypothetical protein
MDLNQAFAVHWDKMNPSAHKQACEHSRQLFEDAEKRKNKDKYKYKDTDKLQCEKIHVQTIKK